MNETTERSQARSISAGLVHPEFESIVSRIVQTVDKATLSELRRDFHTRLRITLTQPDSADLIEDLWDFFYDWCVFERKLPESIDSLPGNVQSLWSHVKDVNERGLYSVQKADATGLKLKELYSAKTFFVPKKEANDFLGISRGDIIEGRLMGEEETGEETKKKKETAFSFVRRPSYHPQEVHDYIKKKVRQFKRSKDFNTYQTWLWLLVGMYLKHRIYDHMPIEKIYDDNSRI